LQWFFTKFSDVVHLPKEIDFTEERQRAEGRRQKEENIFLPSATGFKAPNDCSGHRLNLFMKKEENMYFEMRSAYLLHPY
jgi:hypothetical protein